MLSVGITGGIGSGKSVVCEVFRILGIHVYSADERAKSLMEESVPLRRELIKILGADALDAYGKLDRATISNRIFNDPALLARVNSAVHPFVIHDFRRWRDSCGDQPYVLMESAIILEAGLREEVDALILVDAPESVRTERIINRDKRSVEAIKAIMARQWTQEKKSAFADYIITNDDSHAIIPQVIEIDKSLRKKSEANSAC